MGSDQLYQIALRMRELKQMNKTFGGVCLFWDPAQLKPVFQRFVSKKPCSEEYHLAYGDGSEPLWRSFRVIFLMENHRQGNDKTYAEILNRMRIGEQTKEDIGLLNHPDLKAKQSTFQNWNQISSRIYKKMDQYVTQDFQTYWNSRLEQE